MIHLRQRHDTKSGQKIVTHIELEDDLYIISQGKSLYIDDNLINFASASAPTEECCRPAVFTSKNNLNEAIPGDIHISDGICSIMDNDRQWLPMESRDTCENTDKELEEYVKHQTQQSEEYSELEEKEEEELEEEEILLQQLQDRLQQIPVMDQQEIHEAILISQQKISDVEAKLQNNNQYIENDRVSVLWSIMKDVVASLTPAKRLEIIEKYNLDI